MKPRVALGLITIASLAIVSLGVATLWNYDVNVGPYNVTFKISGQEPYPITKSKYPGELKPDPIFGWMDGSYGITLYQPEKYESDDIPFQGSNWVSYIYIIRKFNDPPETIAELFAQKNESNSEYGLPSKIMEFRGNKWLISKLPHEFYGADTLLSPHETIYIRHSNSTNLFQILDSIEVRGV